MNNISTSVTRIAQLVGEPLGNFLRPVPDFSENHAEAQFSNRINSLAPVASQAFHTETAQIHTETVRTHTGFVIPT